MSYTTHELQSFEGMERPITSTQKIDGVWRASLPLVVVMSDLLELDLDAFPTKETAHVDFGGYGKKSVTVHRLPDLPEHGWIDLAEFPDNPYDLASR